ncbi:MAG TPA: hypothetical protein PKY83_06690 [Bacteroidales bacterium]|jgi:hypothetical protein|nr:hypothetical protein [Bacteroidales bacterium]OQC56850.1 MAG: hypothetical protein BWX52_01418 [Bacteroidetes bacterium ADurb.Bin013]MCZ2317067.1 hypothetical protein [Bacteroidales bacterium]NLZ08419.1 hypothetical protein [Bacteroidales bacterium]HNT48532.1 hypothetical protein [Bacteroidales bacterium]
MKKTFLLLGAFMLSMIVFSSCDKEQEQVSLLYKEVIYEFTDGVNYFTATLINCNGVRDVNDPSKGTIYATISIKANRSCNVQFISIEGLIDDTYITEYAVFPMVYYTSTPFLQEVTFAKDQVITLNLEFPDVSSRLLKVGRLRVASVINNFKQYAFTVHQIPYKPASDIIVWN